MGSVKIDTSLLNDGRMYDVIITSETHPAPVGVYRKILPTGQYFLINSLEKISGTYPRAADIDKSPAFMQIGAM